MAQADAPTQAQREAAHRRPDGAPPVREDGLCYTCGGVRPPIAVAHDDPWCRSECARAYWGTSLPPVQPGVRR